MCKVWEEYKHIKCGDFLKWWSQLNTKQKLEWREKKDQIDHDIDKRIRCTPTKQH